jgi:phenylacetate-coenzyme A ligase PaaK-like adenylate-forming protein
MLIGSECKEHDGLHLSMETMIVELIVRERDGTIRHARPGETGEVVITDLHNLAQPLIRYVGGDSAVARARIGVSRQLDYPGARHPHCRACENRSNLTAQAASGPAAIML